MLSPTPHHRNSPHKPRSSLPVSTKSTRSPPSSAHHKTQQPHTAPRSYVYNHHERQLAERLAVEGLAARGVDRRAEHGNGRQVEYDFVVKPGGAVLASDGIDAKAEFTGFDLEALADDVKLREPGKPGAAPAVQTVEQQPRPPVAHAERLRRLA